MEFYLNCPRWLKWWLHMGVLCPYFVATLLYQSTFLQGSWRERMHAGSHPSVCLPGTCSIPRIFRILSKNWCCPSTVTFERIFNNSYRPNEIHTSFNLMSNSSIFWKNLQRQIYQILRNTNTSYICCFNPHMCLNTTKMIKGTIQGQTFYFCKQ
jgi:hypothetical protein